MTAKIVTFGISKGGASKSTSSGITAWILSQEARVLCIDMDGQGNLTSMLTKEYDLCEVFHEATILEALKEKDVRPYILKVSDNLHIVPSNDLLAMLPSEMFRKKTVNYDSFKDALEPVLDYYDYIIVDTPPSLGEATLLGLSGVSEEGVFAVTMFDGSMFCYYAIPKFLEIVDAVNDKMDRNVQKAGILFSIIDQRVKENDTMVDLVERNYPGQKFDTVIRRKAATRRIPIEGFEENPEIREALEFYYPFVEELKERVGAKNEKQKEGDELEIGSSE